MKMVNAAVTIEDVNGDLGGGKITLRFVAPTMEDPVASEKPIPDEEGATQAKTTITVGVSDAAPKGPAKFELQAFDKAGNASAIATADIVVK